MTAAAADVMTGGQYGTMQAGGSADESHQDRSNKLTTAEDTQHFAMFGNGYQECTFSTVNAGLGCMLHVELPEGKSGFQARGDTVVGMNAHLKSTVSVVGASSWPRAMGRLMAGGPFVLQQVETTNGRKGDALVAPENIGDIAVIDMDGGAVYMRRDAYLASTPGVTLSGRLNPSSALGIRRLRAKGTGTLAITSYGGLFRLHLDKDERFVVEPKHVVAWNGSLSVSARKGKGFWEEQEKEPEQQQQDGTTGGAGAAGASAGGGATPEGASASAVSVEKEGMASVLGAAKGVAGVLGWVRDALRTFFLPKPAYVLVQGPGDLFLQSRLRPRLEVQTIEQTVQPREGDDDENNSSNNSSSNNKGVMAKMLAPVQDMWSNTKDRLGAGGETQAKQGEDKDKVVAKVAEDPPTSKNRS